MTGEMIGEAIVRAAGMVGMIKSAPKPVEPGQTRVRTASADRRPAGERERAPLPLPKITLPPPAQTIDADLASAIDAEIGSLVSGKRGGTGGADPHGERVPAKTASAPGVPPLRPPVAALRRALFRH